MKPHPLAPQPVAQVAQVAQVDNVDYSALPVTLEELELGYWRPKQLGGPKISDLSLEDSKALVEMNNRIYKLHTYIRAQQKPEAGKPARFERKCKTIMAGYSARLREAFHYLPEGGNCEMSMEYNSNTQ